MINPNTVVYGMLVCTMPGAALLVLHALYLVCLKGARKVWLHGIGAVVLLIVPALVGAYLEVWNMAFHSTAICYVFPTKEILVDRK